MTDQVATKLDSLRVKHSLPWTILAIQAFISAISHRTLHSTMSLLKRSCQDLKNIKIPSLSWIYNQRWSMNEILQTQSTRFMANAKHLVIQLDGTALKNYSYYSVVLINEMGVRHLVDMKSMVGKKGMDGYDMTVNILGR